MSRTVKRVVNRNKLLAIPILIACIMAWFLWPQSDAEAGWMNDNYTYRQLFSFTHNAAITTERKVTFSLDTAELITAGTMQSDCDDTRFTDINGKILKYDLTGTCNNAATTYEVIFPTTLNGVNAAYVYYGNPSAFNNEIDSTSITALTPSGGDPSITDRTSEETGPGPVAYWKMDEGVNNTCVSGDDVCDNTRHTNNGNISGAAWQKNDKCVDGKCLFFDGTDDVVTVSNKDSIDLNTGLVNGFTIEAWIRANSDGENGVGEIINKGNGTFIRISNDGTDGFADIEAQLDQFDTEDSYVIVTNGITLNKWHHIAVSFNNDSDDEITLYIDGKKRAESTTGFGNPVAESNNLLIGGGTSANFHGFIDEAKIYPYERSAAEIQTDYNSVSASGDGAVIGESTETHLSSGLVGYWKMNELSWDGTSNEVVDDSGNRNYGTRSGNATTASGIFDKTGTFDGTGDYVSGSGSSLGSLNMYGKSELTMSAWVNTSFPSASAYQGILNNGSAGNGYLLDTTQPNGYARVVIDQDWGGTKDLNSTTVVTDGTWHHIAATLSREGSKSVLRLFVDGQLENQSEFSPYTITTSSSSFQIGTRSSINSMNGKIDEARIYNRALSPREVRELYEWAPGPIGYWNLDENSGGDGTTIYDRSAESHDITIETGVIIVGGSTPVHQQTVTGTNTGTPSYVSTSSNVTAASGQLYIAAVSGKNASSVVSSIRGPDSSTSWTQIEDQCSTNSQTDVSLWYRYGTPTSDGTVTAIFSSSPSNEAAIAVSRYSGANSTTPIPVSTAANQNGVDDVTCATSSTSTNPTVNITTTTDASLLYGAIAKRLRTFTPGPSFNERADFDSGGGGNAAGLAIIDKASTTTGSYAVGGTLNTATNWAVAAAELKVGSTTTTDTANKWETGKYGSSFKFDGTDDFISIIDNSDFDFTTSDSFTLETWFKRSVKTSGTDAFISKYESSASDGGYQLLMEADGDITCGVDTDNSSFPLDGATTTAATYDDGVWHHAACVKDGSSSIKLYIDGVLTASDTSLTASGTYANNDPLYFGIAGDGTSNALNGRLDDIRIYRHARTTKQVIQDMNAGHPAGGSPVGSQIVYWKFDEMYGTTANDKTGHQNGTVDPNTSWRRDGACKINGCILFDAAGEEVSIATANDAVIDFNGTESFSGSAWVYINSMPGSGEYDGIITKWDQTSALRAYRLVVTNDDADTTGNFRVDIYDESTDQTISAIGATDSIQTNTWYHVGFSFNGGITGSAGDLILFVDGNNVAQNSANGSFAGLEDIAADFVVGEYDETDVVSTHTAFTGYIDELKMYAGSLNIDEMRTDMNAGASTNFGTGNNEARVLTDGSGASVYRYWPLDSNTGTTTVYDKSGNGITGDMTGSMVATSWVQGVYGSALQFDGTDDAIQINSPGLPTGDFTYEAWFNHKQFTTGGAAILMAADGSGANEINITANTDNTLRAYVDGTTLDGDLPYTYGKWHFATLVRSGSTIQLYLDGIADNSGTDGDTLSFSTCPFYIGLDVDSLCTGGLGNYFDGKIDDVKVYNYARTQAQIMYDYNRGKPVGWWRFDECTGTTANDATGRGNNGTITIDGSGSNTSVGTCSSGTTTESWNNGTNGKFGASLDFDGNDDRVSITSAAPLQIGDQDMSISAWIYPDSFGSYKTLYDKGTSGTAREYSFFINSTTDGWIAFGHDGTSGVATTFDIPFTTGEWQHVAIIRSGSTVNIYRNGELTETVTQSATTTNTTALSIGYNTSGSASNWDGKIDDFRVYNYALSASQVRQVMVGGEVRFE